MSVARRWRAIVVVRQPGMHILKSVLFVLFVVQTLGRAASPDPPSSAPPLKDEG
jgi:hypothetical protein